jgi:putative membrane protein
MAQGGTRDHETGGRAVPLVLALFVLAAVPLSYVGAYDRATWWMEAVPVVIGLPLMAATWRQHRLSTLLYMFIALHCLILLLGAHYTYARVPAGDWAAQLFGWSRNNYDKLGHFAQGFVPALLTREILVRFSAFRAAPRSRFVPILAVAAPLAFSALYEIIEWQAAMLAGAAADDFLGTQGDPWDTQSDMALALAGALAALVSLSRLHDRSIARVEARLGRRWPEGVSA